MTERRTYLDRSSENVIIRNQQSVENSQFSFNNGPSQVHTNEYRDQFGTHFYDQRSVREINEENRNLRELIKKIEEKNQSRPQNLGYKQQGSNLQDRIDFNSRKINELSEIVDEQRKVIVTYKRQLEQFEKNLIGIMKLDKDIHSKLVNPHTSSTLQKNVKNVLVALNSKAPYDKLIKMIENIRV